MCPVPATKLLIIDDQADVERGKLAVLNRQISYRVRYPWDVTLDDLNFANVVVVDFRLDETWVERDELRQIALKPMNGLALAAVLRSHERAIDGCPTAFLLRSAHLEDLSPEFPPDSRLHVIARQNNLEWVFSKSGSVDEQMRQTICLAEAVESLPESWPNGDANAMKDLLKSWLGVPSDERWADLAWQDIEQCHPPIHELSSRKQGLRLVRWMLHRILPYPCFLMTTRRLAVRLKVVHESLRIALEHGLSECLTAAEYTGTLTKFDGEPRWWRRGIESILWDITNGESFDSIKTLEILNNHCDEKLLALDMSQPVLCLDKEYCFREAPGELSDSVMVQPDDWPAFAEQAWASLLDATNEPRLLSIVVAADRERIEPEGI